MKLKIDGIMETASQHQVKETIGLLYDELDEVIIKTKNKEVTEGKKTLRDKIKSDSDICVTCGDRCLELNKQFIKEFVEATHSRDWIVREWKRHKNITALEIAKELAGERLVD